MRTIPIVAIVLTACGGSATGASDKVTVEVNHNEAALGLRITNHFDEPIKVDWDGSSFVDATGKSWGRLIKGETSKIAMSATQVPTPVAPSARVEQLVIPEGFVASIDENKKAPIDDFDKAHVFVAVETPNGKKTVDIAIDDTAYNAERAKRKAEADKAAADAAAKEQAARLKQQNIDGQIERSQAAAHALGAGALRTWHRANSGKPCPTDSAQFNVKDEWGKPFRIECRSDPLTAFITSAGPDGKFDTYDDFLASETL